MFKIQGRKKKYAHTGVRSRNVVPIIVGWRTWELMDRAIKHGMCVGYYQRRRYGKTTNYVVHVYPNVVISFSLTINAFFKVF